MTTDSDEEHIIEELLTPLEISETFVEEEDTFAQKRAGESSFLDFSLKSPFEKLVSSFEYAFNDWLFASKFEALVQDESLKRSSEFGGPYHASVSKEIEHKMHFRRNSYMVSLHFDFEETKIRGTARSDHNTSRNLQRWFRCDTFFVIEPMSYSKRFADNDEAATIRSAASVALNNLTSNDFPVFTPIDRSSNRNSIVGISFSKDIGSSCFYESDSMVGFTSENAFCALSSTSKVVFSIARNLIQLAAVVRTTVCYRIIMDGSNCSIKDNTGMLEEVSDEDDIERDIVIEETSPHPSPSWDEDQIWARWVTLTDPFDSIELDCFFERDIELNNTNLEGEFVEDGLENADMYTIRSIPNGVLIGGIAALSGSPPMDFSQISGTQSSHDFGLAELLHICSSEIYLNRGENNDLYVSASADEIASDEWWTDRLRAQPPHTPPEAVLDDFLLDIFEDFTNSDDEFPEGNTIVGIPKTAKGCNSLLSRVSVHAMKLKSARAIAELWRKFTKELRYKHWERGEPLPRMSGHGIEAIEVDHSACLLEQQLQLLNACIHRRLRCTKPESSKDVIKRDPLKLKKKNSDVSNESKQNANASVWKTDDDLDLNALLNDDISLTAVAASNKASQKTEDTFEDASEVMLTEDFGEKRKESDLKSQLEMRLIGAPQVLIREPETQLYPIYTEGECDERVTVANSMLTSDMCAFKAANPRAQFVDFVRWHSPRDFVDGKLSERMSKPGNTWETMFKDAEPIAAKDQKLLFDPITEGERVLHLLETAKFDTILRYLCALGANTAFCIYAESCVKNLRCAGSMHPLLDEKLQRCRDICASVFYNVNEAKQEDFAQAAYEIQLIERTAARAASLRKQIGEKCELNFIIERLWIDSVKREYESEARRVVGLDEKEEGGGAFTAVNGVCSVSNDEERRIVLENIGAKRKIACEYEVEEKGGVNRLHVSTSARFTRISSVSC